MEILYYNNTMHHAIQYAHLVLYKGILMDFKNMNVCVVWHVFVAVCLTFNQHYAMYNIIPCIVLYYSNPIVIQFHLYYATMHCVCNANFGMHIAIFLVAWLVLHIYQSYDINKSLASNENQVWITCSCINNINRPFKFKF